MPFEVTPFYLYLTRQLPGQRQQQQAASREKPAAPAAAAVTPATIVEPDAEPAQPTVVKQEN